jgi:peroxiredoxin
MKKILLVALMFGMCTSCLKAENTPFTGCSVSKFDGSTVNLSDFKGTPVLLFFWTTWCPYCRTSIKKLDAMQSEIAQAGVKLLVIDVGEPKERVEAFLSRQGIEMPVLLDPRSQCSETFKVMGVPTYVLIDKESQVKSVQHEFPDDYKDVLIGTAGQ